MFTTLCRGHSFYLRVIAVSFFLIVPLLHVYAFPQQLLWVETPNWGAHQGILKRYQFIPKKHCWVEIGKIIPVVVGKNGIAPGVGFPVQETVFKREGDNKTPAGIFEIGPLFTRSTSPTSTKFPVLFLKNNTVCVDDQHSRYYNRIINYSPLQIDWQSAESMYTVPGYKEGLVIRYNTKPLVVGAGSCIFMHIWKNATTGTAGCIAMSEKNLLIVLKWLERGAHPKIIVTPKNLYSLKDLSRVLKRRAD